MLEAVKAQGYESPTPIQGRCVPVLLDGHDLLGQAQTGTGKTAAFALPVLCKVELFKRVPQALVLTPTRELALQVAEAFAAYSKQLPGFRVLPVYGGQGIVVQLRQLDRGVHVIVGTPGRVMDHLRRGSLSLDDVKMLVLDEADEMLKMGFAEDIDEIFEQAPKPRQVALFSATMPASARKIAAKHLVDPVEVKVEAKTQTVSTIEQRHVVVPRHKKLDTLTRILEVENFDAMLIFARTKAATMELTEKLVAHGFAAEALNGDLSQQLRERTVQRLRDSKLDILVATDVAARGLDVERISHVVNYDIPSDPEAYVHRIGRTGRAGREGRSILFVQPRERRLLKHIERTTNQRIEPMRAPTDDALAEVRLDAFVEKLRKAAGDEDLDAYREFVAKIVADTGLTTDDLAAAMTFMLQGERPLVVEPEEAPEPRWKREKGDKKERRDKRERGDDRGGKPRRDAGDDGAPTVRYKLQVGRKHGVTPRQIVGAIANEAGLEGRHIGYVGIHAMYSTVDLPEGMPKHIEKHLSGVRICGRELKLERTEGRATGRPPRKGGPPHKKHGGDKR